VPTMPAVEEGVIELLAIRVVKAPVLAAVLPIGPGEAKRAVKPAPLTAPLADKVVNTPDPGVVPPIGPGAANVAPPKVAALTVVLHPKPVPLV
jgi:hypothetical protein